MSAALIAAAQPAGALLPPNEVQISISSDGRAAAFWDGNDPSHWPASDDLPLDRSRRVIGWTEEGGTWQVRAEHPAAVSAHPTGTLAIVERPQRARWRPGPAAPQWRFTLATPQGERLGCTVTDPPKLVEWLPRGALFLAGNEAWRADLDSGCQRLRSGVDAALATRDGLLWTRGSEVWLDDKPLGAFRVAPTLERLRGELLVHVRWRLQDVLDREELARRVIALDQAGDQESLTELLEEYLRGPYTSQPFVLREGQLRLLEPEKEASLKQFVSEGTTCTFRASRWEACYSRGRSLQSGPEAQVPACGTGYDADQDMHSRLGESLAQHVEQATAAARPGFCNSSSGSVLLSVDRGARLFSWDGVTEVSVDGIVHKQSPYPRWLYPLAEPVLEAVGLCSSAPRYSAALL